MVLFVFVIMLVRLDVALHQIQFSKQKWVALLVTVALGAQVGVMFWATRKMPGQGLFVREAAPADKLPPNSEALAQRLFSNYLLPFEIASVLLLVAMVGAVVMAKKRSQPRMMPIGHYLFLSLALFLIGTIGVITRRNVIIVLMSIELILNAVNINLVAFSRIFGTAGRMRGRASFCAVHYRRCRGGSCGGAGHHHRFFP